MEKKLLRVAVSGTGGQIAYNLLFRLASGEAFGLDQPIALHLLEVEQSLPALQGVVMELEDCSYPLLREIKTGSNPYELFGDIDVAILVGAKPRGPGMERKDLLHENGKIFVEQGKALEKAAKRNALVFVVGNPCNTNCLIAMSHAPSLDYRRFHAMTMLDHNRARFQLAKKAGVSLLDVDKVCIWGNHSSTQVPDVVNVRIKGENIEKVIHDTKWLENDFISSIQKRGAEVIAARGKSSAASAANAVVDAMKSLYRVHPKSKIFSSGILAEKNPYGIRGDIIFSFPLMSDGEGNVEIVPDYHLNSFLKEKIAITQKELVEERDMVASLLG